MARSDVTSGVSGLYQLPLAEFTAARNALARTAGKEGAAIKGLAKPPVAAWAVNQLFWRQRRVYDELVDAATEMRMAHAAVLGGRKADPRVAGKRHEEAVEAALKAALQVLRDDDQPATDATRQAIATTLRALPAADAAPGQLDRVLQPGGFEMLAGMTLAGAPPGSRRPAAPPAVPAPAPSRPGPEPPSRVEKAVAAARAAAAEAARELRTAEHAAEREEFRAARASREADKAAKTLAEAESEVEKATRALETARRSHQAAVQAHAAVESDVDRARARVKAARTGAAQAEAVMKKAERG